MTDRRTAPPLAAAGPAVPEPTGQAALAPGLLVVVAATAAAFVVARLVPALNEATVAVVLGAVVTNVGVHRRPLRPGTAWAARRLLRIAVVLLGLQLALPQLARLGFGGLAVVLVTVAVTFAGTRLLGRLVGLPPARSLLVATGFSICGASAVAAMAPVADGDEEDTAVAIALVTLCGSLAILVLPLLRVPLGLDVPAFGSWVGASVHDVGQTVATAGRVPGALTGAVVVKLTRVVLLAPLVAGVSLARRRGTRQAGRIGVGGTRVGGTGADGTRADGTRADGTRVGGKRPPVMPLFVAGFLAAVLVVSTGLVPGSVLDGAKTVQQVLLAAALFGLGTGIDVARLVRTGARSLVVGLGSWLLVAGVAYGGVRLLGL